jgi:hypothetical protein
MRFNDLLHVPPMSRLSGLGLTTALATLALSTACSGDVAPGAAGAAGTSSNPATGAGAGTGSGNAATTAGATSMTGTGGTTSTGGVGATSSGAGGVPASSGGASSNAGSGGGLELPHPTNTDHCLYGYSPEASDDTMAAGPVVFKAGSADDTTFQPEILKWMEDNKWRGAHVIWHAVRGCMDGSAAGLLNPLGFPNICKDYPVLIPADQNCKTAGDGYQFLLFHRHMLQTLKQLWPKHAADFEGFPHFPTSAADLPDAFKDKASWPANPLAAGDIGDHIEQHLDQFPDEGALGFWLQCQAGAKLAAAPNLPYVGVHFDLHNQYSRMGSTHGLNDGQVNVTNYMFWKLHGWIDNVWEKYRVAKGLTKEGSPEMEKYKRDMVQSCNEMAIEEEILKSTPGSGPVLDCPPDVDEKGDFHTKVRPIFETTTNHCASCHGPTQSSPYASLTLGGSVSSKCIVDRLKKQSNDGGQFKLVEPGDPDKSWLYLKASGKADAAGCVSSDPNKPCNSAQMPPGGVRTLSDAELETLRKWIADGAAYP